MSLLSDELIKGLLPDLTEQVNPNSKIIGMFGGGFKPPTSGHLEVVKKALQENPEMDSLIILVGSGTRNSISQEESINIWNIYKKSLPNKVRVMASPDNKPPIGAIYSYAKKNPNKEIYWFIGAREGNEEDFQDIADRTKSLRKGDYQNIKVKEIVTGGAVSGTKARQALLANDKETFIQTLPDIPEVDEIWDMLTSVVKERSNFSTDFISQDDVEFVDDMADRKLSPIDVDLSGNHFFDRLNDPRNFPDISVEELEEFFDKLSDEKEKFIEFLRRYKDVVVKDTESNLNIPFMKRANKAIAKTIMRKKDFMTSNKVLPLDEGRYDAEVTMLSRMIINVFKDHLDKKLETTFEDVGELSDGPYDLELYSYPTDFDKLGPLPFIVSGAGDEDGIAIQINYQVDRFPNAYNELVPELKDAIRHELEHVAQFRFDKGIAPSDIDQDDLPLFDYLTLDYEIAAFVQGLYKKAKTKKISFTAAVDEFLDERIEELTPKEAEKIKQIYINYAKKNLPTAQITEGKYDSLVTKLAGFTLNAWKDDFNGGSTLGYFEVEVGPGEEFNYPHLTFNFTAEAKMDKGLNYSDSSFARPLVPEVRIKMTLDTDELPRMWEQTAMDLRNTIRHEIEHLMQSGPNVKAGKEKALDQEERKEIRTGKKKWWKIWRKTLGTPDYYKLEKEVDANLQGLYFKAKKSRMPLKQVIDNYVKYELNLPLEDQEEVKRIWAERAPKLNIPLQEKRDPKKGTGKKPKGSSRRLYTDEDPKDTVGIKFSTRQDIVNTLGKTSFKVKSHARQSQVINLIHQRVRAAYGRAKKPEVKKRLKTALDYITKRKEASKAKTKRLQSQRKKKKANENVAHNHNQKSSPYGSGYKPLKENLTPQILSLTQYMDENGLDLKPYPTIKFISNDRDNAENVLGRTAYYDPNQHLVALYTMNRHPKDILRSYAHELVHHHQNLNNTLNHGQTTNTNKDDNLDKLEREAYETGNILFRNWEDSIKNQ